MGLHAKPSYDFGPFRLDSAEHLLLCEGQPVHLPPKAFELLLVLVRNQGRLLEKDELLRTVWPDAFVEEANLSYNISLIRKALGGNGVGRASIQTVPKLGYRFLAQVTEVKEDDRNLTTEESSTHRPMPMNQICVPNLVRFGEFEADLRVGELRKQDSKISLPVDLFKALAMLLECAGEFVTPEQIQNRLWPNDRPVESEQSIEVVMVQLQLALGDTSGNPRFVETVAGRGYRFIASVEARGVEVAFVPNGGRALANVDALGGRPAESSAQPPENQKTIAASALPHSFGPTNQAELSTPRKWITVGLALTLLSSVLFWWAPHRPRAAREPLLTRLTSDPGLTTDAVISPDGKLIAFASDRGGNNLDLYVRQVSGGDPLQLTSDPADDHQPAFSPDGGQIVFRSEREGGGVYIISALGHKDRLLAPRGRNPRFSPAGDWIAYWVGLVAGHPLGAQAGKIFLIPPTGGGAPKPIDPPGIVAAGCPIWSPDGTHLLFYGSDSESYAAWFPTSDLWVWPLAGGNPVKTGAFPAFAAQNIRLRVPDPVPAPAEWIDDRVYFSAKTGDSVNLWQVSISPKNWLITGPAYRVTSGSGLEIRPSLAKTGLLVFSSLVDNPDIFSLPIDATQGQAKGPLEQLTRDLAADYSPSMSADGKKLAYVSWRSGNADIWIKDLESGKEKPLTESPAEEIAPRISPDGSLVSFAIRAAGTGALAEDIRLLPAEGGLLQKLCDGCGAPWGWSPDNKLLFHLRGRGPKYTIEMINLATGKAGNCLQSSEFSLFHATLTRDGRWIAFNAMDRQASPPRLEVLVAAFQRYSPSKESDWIRVVSDQSWNDKPRWSPDGNRIYFVSDRDGFACLWSQPVEPETKRPVGPPVLLYHIHQVRRSILNVGYGLMDIAVAPDKIVLNLGEMTGNIWMTKLK